MQRAFFDRIAVKRERDIRRHRLYYVDRARWLKHLIPSDASVIELGCGTGPTISGLSRTKKTGIDFSPEMIRIAEVTDPTTHYLVDDIEHLAHREAYDYVLLLDTINFLDDVQQGLRSVRRQLCHDRTRLVVTYYNFLWQPLFLLAQALRWKTRFPEQNWLGRGDIENLLALTGFDVVQVGGRLLLPVGIPLLSTFVNRFLSSLPLLRSLCLVQYIIARPVAMDVRSYSVTVLSAVRNERGNIEKIASSLPDLGASTELLFVEGHSTDSTWEEIERVVSSYSGPIQIRGIQQEGTGKADALHCGARSSTGDIILIYDGDFTVNPSALQKVYDALVSGRAEFVNASRLVYPLERGAMRVLNLLGNKFFSILFSWLFGQKLKDPLSPVKGFFRRDYTRMHSRMDPFGDFDFFLGAAKQQLQIREVPVHYLPRSYGSTKIRRFHHAWLLFRMFLAGSRVLKWI